MEKDPKETCEAKQPAVLVVILNWNGWEGTAAAVDSVLRQDYANFRIRVIDNGSIDESVTRLRAICVDRVELLELPENRGYTGGCNAGIKHALATGAQYAWLFNSDAVCAAKDTLSSLVALAETDTKIGLVCPRIAEPGEEGRLTFVGGICSMHPFLFDFTHDPDEALRWTQQYPQAGAVSGAAMLVKTSAVQDIGMLDESLFAYFESTDYSYRSSLAGYRNLVDEHSTIWHPQKKEKLNPLAIKPYYWYYRARNECLFWRKHLGIVRGARLLWWAFRNTLVKISRCREDRNITDAILAGVWHGWVGRGGAYRPEYRMPRPLAAAIWKYALTKAPKP